MIKIYALLRVIKFYSFSRGRGEWEECGAEILIIKILFNAYFIHVCEQEDEKQFLATRPRLERRKGLFMIRLVHFNY